MTSLRFRVLTGCVIAMALIAGVGWTCRGPVEPTWEGRPLSEWLDAYDSHNRFDENDYRGLRSPLWDEEIEQALQAMTPEALPVLLDWLTTKPSAMKMRANSLLAQHSWIPFRFEDRDYPILAVTGFMAYSTNAQPLLPDLLELSRSPDPDTRLVAYEAAFFTWPDKDIFMSLVARALHEEDQGVQEMAASWQAKRFPAEAETRTPWLRKLKRQQ